MCILYYGCALYFQANGIRGKLDLVQLSFDDLNCTGAEAGQKGWLRRCISAANKKLVGAVVSAGERGHEDMTEAGAIRALVKTIQNEEV